MAVLKKIKFGNSENSIQFTEVKPASGGVITATGAHTELTDKDNPEYVVDLTIADDGTLVKDNGALKVGTVPAAQVSVADSAGVFTAENVETALKELKDDIAGVDSKAKSYTIIKETSKTENVTLDSNVKEQYRLQQTIGETSEFVGETIKIYKDSSLKSVALNGQNLDFTYILADGTESTVSVDISTFLAESEFKNGLQVTNGEVSAKLGQGLEFGGETGENQTIKVKVDSTSEKDTQSTPVDFLTVGTNGIKIQGIGAEIDRKIAALDVTDTAVTGQYVSQVSETDGKIAVVRRDVSAAPLNGYAKGSDELPLAATDTINQAFSKIEASIKKNEQTTATALTEIDNRIKGMDKAASAADGQVVTTVSEADGIVNETKANVKDLQLGGYAKDESAKSPIGGTDTINTALSKLENAIDAAKAAATTKVVEGTDAGNNLEISSAISQTDGSTTYTISLTNVASKTALDAEIAARKAVDGQNGDKYAANANTNYISGATSLNDADVKLDAAIKAEETRAKAAESEIADKVGLTGVEGSRTFTPTTNYGTGSTTVVGNMQALDTQLKAITDKVGEIQYKVSGTTLEFFGLTAHT